MVFFFLIKSIIFAQGPDLECDKKCANGGHCDENKICQCPEGYMGQHCNTALCYPQCMNNGTCTAPGVCSCPAGYQGRHCEGGTTNRDYRIVHNILSTLNIIRIRYLIPTYVLYVHKVQSYTLCTYVLLCFSSFILFLFSIIRRRRAFSRAARADISIPGSAVLFRLAFQNRNLLWKVSKRWKMYTKGYV